MPFTIEESIVVDRSMEEIFEYLDDDTETFAEWRRPPWMRLRRISEGPTGIGTQYETALSILGMRQGPIVTEVVAYDPPRRLVWKARNTTPLIRDAGGEYLMREIERGTRVSISGRVRFPWWLRPFEPLGRIIFDRQYLRPMMHRLAIALDNKSPG